MLRRNTLSKRATRLGEVGDFVNPPSSPLPIERVLPDVVAALRNRQDVVVEGPTGAGKTTCVPLAILDSQCVRGRIVMIEPRRLAARAAAQRMADLRGQPVGREIGYHVRFDRCCRADTRVLVVTEGIFARKMLDDPFLEGTDVVIFDEFHERRLDSDVALGMVRALSTSARPDLRTLVMSATLPADSLVAYLRPSRLVRAEGHVYPVSIEYRPPANGESPSASVARAVRDAVRDERGDVLVFLPGLREIKEVERAVRGDCDSRRVAIVELYGDLPLERQRAALDPSDRRRVVLATNVAETSVTVEGVTTVIDCGLEKSLRFDPRLGLDRLRTVPISRSSAGQRAGRAGRTAPGRCLRLWSEARDRDRAERIEPEVARLDLSRALLRLACASAVEPAEFPWYERPSAPSIDAAFDLLRRLGAWDGRAVTPLGRALAELPVPPRVGRLLIEGARRGAADRAALAAALLTERDPFLRGDRSPREAVHRTRSDLLDRVECLERFESEGATRFPLGTLSASSARGVLRARDQLRNAVRHDGRLASDAPPIDVPTRRRAAIPDEDRDDPDDGLLRALLAAFPDRLARRRGPGDRRAVMERGRGARLASESGVCDAELFLCLDVDAGEGEAFVRSASEVRREWLIGEGRVEETRLEYDRAADRIGARRRVLWGDLVLDDHPAAVTDEGEAAALLADAALGAWNLAAPRPDSPAREWLARWRCARIWFPNEPWPSADDATLRRHVREAARGCRSLEQMREQGWLAWIRAQLDPDRMRILDRDLPTHWRSPRGHRARLTYDDSGRPPILAVRMQDLFGVHSTPRIARGRIGLVLHILAPNQRPVQITDDLSAFWKNLYPKVRHELSRRYPKHAWPENPTTL